MIFVDYIYSVKAAQRPNLKKHIYKKQYTLTMLPLFRFSCIPNRNQTIDPKQTRFSDHDCKISAPVWWRNMKKFNLLKLVEVYLFSLQSDDSQLPGAQNWLQTPEMHFSYTENEWKPETVIILLNEDGQMRDDRERQWLDMQLQRLWLKHHKAIPGECIAH